MINLLNPIKGYIAGAIAAIVAIFIAVFKYRGSKIENLEKEVELKDKQAAEIAKVVEQEKKVAEYESANKVAAAVASIPVQPKDYVEEKTVEGITKRFYSI